MIEHFDTTRDMVHVLANIGTFGEVDDVKVSRYVGGSERLILTQADGEVLCVWGSARPYLLSDQGYIWMADGPALQRHRLKFLRSASRIVDMFYVNYSSLVGFAQPCSERWLSWLGAELGPAGPHGRPFIFRRA